MGYKDRERAKARRQKQRANSAPPSRRPRSVIELDRAQSVPDFGLYVYRVRRDGVTTSVVQSDNTPLKDENGSRLFRTLELLAVADGTADSELLQAYADVFTNGDLQAAQSHAEKAWREYVAADDRWHASWDLHD